VIAYLSLDYTQSVKIPDVLSVLKEAAEGNGFGDFQVDPGSIQAISDDQLPTVSSTSTVGAPTSGTVAGSFVSLFFFLSFLIRFYKLFKWYCFCKK